MQEIDSYFDSSFLVSLYTPDANSAAAAARIRHAIRPFPLVPFGELELINAIQLRLFRREIKAAQAMGALADLASDTDSGLFSPVPATAAIYERGL